ncbi:cisplatin damage response ATP-dependent DNA ligase [Sphingomonas lacunae]|uniref:DNA ligase (ATP) n=1 Tax=Sphingomonas lacunae TaxID=2698828 RepID=A0A6M4AY44_9SPHN|nr:cisplatin damage response ATP-dependent DNA ligase [Sphingomonas lacunae]QJQ31901.1 cisplatin damage response ATP-dependent DNA ligase [Sphingomonas lacunae]
MRAFAELIDRLTYTRSRNAKLRLIGDYLKGTADPDRGWALAALTGEVNLPAVKPASIRAMIEERVDPLLFRMSRDYVGDTAETVALMWPEPGETVPEEETLSLSATVERLAALKRGEGPAVLAAMLDRLDSGGRFALLKLATGALRVGVSGRLARTAVAEAFGLEVDAIEQVWHGLAPPYAELFDWAEGRGGAPDLRGRPTFRPFMLAHPLEDGSVDLSEYVAEWKWDGIRVQLVHCGGETRLYSRGGDDITAAFPDVAGDFAIDAVLDGELLVRGEVQGGSAGGAASFNALQQRLGRKSVSAAMLRDSPAFVRLYDVLDHQGDDLRALPWHRRRDRLEALMAELPPHRFDLSAIIEAADFDALSAIRDGARDSAIEGVMLKRRDSPYVPGRRVGLWYKWKRDPLRADCVLMYAQRGSGKRSSYYSDFTFGCWSGDPGSDGDLLPVGKAYSGFTDEELRWLDKYVRDHTVARYGPVREVDRSLVLEVAFDSIHASRRHKSGLAMRFPRIARIRRDKPAAEADHVATLMAMIDGPGTG